MTEPTDRDGYSLGVRIYEAYRCNFNLMRRSNIENQTAQLALTVDLKAKVTRTTTVLDAIYGGDYAQYGGQALSQKDKDQAERTWAGETVITTHDRKCFSVIKLMFDHSANTLKIPDKNISHTEYFKSKKIILKYPDARPIVAVQGRRNQTIYFPAEMIAGNELDSRVKEKLPIIASFKPDQRNAALDKVCKYLTPGAQTSKNAGGLLPALGITLATDGRIQAKARVLPVPIILAAGVSVPPDKGENWAPLMSRARFNVNPKKAVQLNVVLVHHKMLKRGHLDVYNRIRDLVNRFEAQYRFGDKPHTVIEAGTYILVSVALF